MNASNVSQFKFDRHLLETGYVKKSIENVDSIVTCSKICFNNLSGWTLTETGICKCMDFPSKFCYPPLFNNKTDIPETNSTDLKFLIDQSKTTVLLSCSGNDTNTPVPDRSIGNHNTLCDRAKAIGSHGDRLCQQVCRSP